MSDNWPYCQHPGCHDPRTNNYAWQTYSNGTTVTGPVGQAMATTTVSIDFEGTCPIGFDRLCRIHALQRYGVAFGGAA